MGLNKSTARAVDMARLHLKTGNPGAYARSLAGERLFTRHPANGCLLALEG